MSTRYLCPICDHELVGGRYCPSCKKRIKEPVRFHGDYLPNEHSERCFIPPKRSRPTPLRPNIPRQGYTVKMENQPNSASKMPVIVIGTVIAVCVIIVFATVGIRNFARNIVVDRQVEPESATDLAAVTKVTGSHPMVEADYPQLAGMGEADGSAVHYFLEDGWVREKGRPCNGYGHYGLYIEDCQEEILQVFEMYAGKAPEKVYAYSDNYITAYEGEESYYSYFNNQAYYDIGDQQQFVLDWDTADERLHGIHFQIKDKELGVEILRELIALFEGIDSSRIEHRVLSENLNQLTQKEDESSYVFFEYGNSEIYFSDSNGELLDFSIYTLRP